MENVCQLFGDLCGWAALFIFQFANRGYRTSNLSRQGFAREI
jgi:hypothetical protein